MTDQAIPDLYKQPQYDGEYLVVANGDGHRIYTARFQRGSFYWHPALLIDHNADTALAAYKLASNHLKSAGVGPTLIADQFMHLTANLAAKQHRLMPFASRLFASEQSLQTMIRLAHLNDTACTQLLCEAGLMPSSPFAANNQALVRVAHDRLGMVPSLLVEAMGLTTNDNQYRKLIAKVFTQHPQLLKAMDAVDPQILSLVNRKLKGDFAHAAERRSLGEWLNAVREGTSTTTNYDYLVGDSGNASQMLYEFGVELLSLSFNAVSSKTPKVKTHARTTVIDQPTLAGYIAGAQLSAGNYEVIDGLATAVFRASESVPSGTSDRQFLSAIFLKEINGEPLTDKSLRQFCNLFCLDFNYNKSLAAIKQAV
ncbi:MAG: hypothetical protein V7693_15775 [Halopseudomonas sabulinigri]